MTSVKDQRFLYGRQFKYKFIQALKLSPIHPDRIRVKKKIHWETIWETIHAYWSRYEERPSKICHCICTWIFGITLIFFESIFLVNVVTDEVGKIFGKDGKNKLKPLIKDMDVYSVYVSIRFIFYDFILI